MTEKNLNEEEVSVETTIEDNSEQINNNEIVETEEVEETEVSEFEFAVTDLQLTLNKKPDLTDEELLDLFPEFEGDKSILKVAKEKALEQGGDTLKKKEETHFLESSSEESNTSESETPSTSEGIDIKTEDKEEALTFSEKDLKRAQKYLDKGWSPDDTINKDAWESIQPEKKEVVEEPSVMEGFDVKSFSDGLVGAENSGKYEWKAKNTTSSASGAFQFLYKQHASWLKKEHKIKNRKEFLNSQTAQEALLSYMLEDKPGRYPHMAKSIQKDYSEHFPEDLTFNDILGLEHFVGHGDLREMFAKIRDNDDVSNEDLYTFKPKGKNLNVGEWLKRFRAGSTTTTEPTSSSEELSDDELYAQSMENPLDDPNLMAGGDDEVQSQVSTDIDDKQKLSQWQEITGATDEMVESYSVDGVYDDMAGVNLVMDNLPALNAYAKKQGYNDLQDMYAKKGEDENIHISQILQTIEKESSPEYIKREEIKAKEQSYDKYNDLYSYLDLFGNEELVAAGVGKTPSAGSDFLSIADRSISQPPESDPNYNRVGLQKNNYEIIGDGSEESPFLITNTINDKTETLFSFSKDADDDGLIRLSDEEKDIALGIVLMSRHKGIEVPPSKMNELIKTKLFQVRKAKETIVSNVITNLIPEDIKNITNSGYATSKINEILDGEEFQDISNEFKNMLLQNNILLPGYTQNDSGILKDYVTAAITQKIYTSFVDDNYKDIHKGIKSVKIKELKDRERLGNHTTQYGADKRQFTLKNTQTEIYDDSDEKYMRESVNNFLGSDKYDNMPKSVKDMIAAKMMDKFHSESPAFVKVKEEEFQRQLDILNDNKTGQLTMYSPEEAIKTAELEITRLMEEKKLPYDDAVKVIEDKYGVTINPGMMFELTDDYMAKYNSIYGKANDNTWNRYEKENPDKFKRDYLGMIIEKQIFGSAYEFFTGRQFNPDYDMERMYTPTERMTTDVLSLVTDPAMYAGSAAAGATIRLGTSFTKYGSRALMLTNLRASAMMYQQAGFGVQKSYKMATTAFNLAKNQYIGRIGYLQSGLAFGNYMGVADVLSQQLENRPESIMDFSYGQTATAYGQGMVLGSLVHHITGLSNTVKAKFNTAGMSSRAFEWGANAAIDGVALSAEVGVFTAAHYDKNVSLTENYVHNLAFIFSLKTAGVPMKLVRTNPAKAKTRYDFNPSQSDKKYMTDVLKSQGQDFKMDKDGIITNDALYDMMFDGFTMTMEGGKENLSKNAKGLLNVPTTVLRSFLESNNLADVAISSADYVVQQVDVKTVDGQSVAVFKNHNGQVLSTANWTGKHIPSMIDKTQHNAKIEMARAVLSEGKVLNTEWSDKLNKALNETNLTQAEIDLFKDNINPEKNHEIFNKVSDVINDVYGSMRTAEKTKFEAFETEIQLEAEEKLKKDGIENPSFSQLVEYSTKIKERLDLANTIKEEAKAKAEQKQLTKEEQENKNKYRQSFQDKDGTITTDNTSKEGVPVSVEVNSDNIITLKDKNNITEIKDAVLERAGDNADFKLELENAKDLDAVKELIKNHPELNIEGFEYKSLAQGINPKGNAFTLDLINNTAKERKVYEGAVEIDASNIGDLKSQATSDVEVQNYNDIVKIQKRLKDNGSDAKVIVHTTNKSFKDMLKKDGKETTAEGEAYVDANGNIHVNKTKLKDGTSAFHEYGHIFKEALRKTNPEKYKALEAEMTQLLETPEFAAIKDAVDVTNKDGSKVYSAAETPQEAMVRLSEAIRDKTIDVSSLEGNKSINSIKKLINKGLKKIGLDVELSTNSELIEFMRDYVSDFEGKGVDKIQTNLNKGDGASQLKAIFGENDKWVETVDPDMKENRIDILEIESPVLTETQIIQSDGRKASFRTKITKVALEKIVEYTEGEKPGEYRVKLWDNIEKDWIYPREGESFKIREGRRIAEGEYKKHLEESFEMKGGSNDGYKSSNVTVNESDVPFSKGGGKLKAVNISKLSSNQTEHHNREGGSTFNREGEVVTEGFAVSRYPDRTKIIEGDKITNKDIVNFVNKNKDVFSENPNAVVGTWYNAENGKTYIDISEVQADKAKAIQVGKESNQIAIMDLKTFEEIPTGGTGKSGKLKSSSPEKDRVFNEIEGIIGKTKKRLTEDVNPEKLEANAISYLQESKWYAKASDVEREAAVREVRKMLDIKEKRPAVQKQLGKPKDNVITMKEKTLLKHQLKTENKGYKRGVMDIKQVKNNISDFISKSDITNSAVSKALLKKAVKATTEKQIDAVIEMTYDAIERTKKRDAIGVSRDLRKKVEAKFKKGLYTNQSEVVRELLDINPAEVKDTDLIIEINDKLEKLNRKDVASLDPVELKALIADAQNVIEIAKKNAPKVKTKAEIIKDRDALYEEIKNGSFDIKDINGKNNIDNVINKVKSLHKNIDKAIEEGYFTKDGKIDVEAIEEIRSSIDGTVNRVLGNKIMEYNTEKHALSQSVLKEINLNNLPKNERELVERVLEAEFINDPRYIDNLYVSALDLSNGYTPTKALSDIVVKSNAQRRAPELAEQMEHAVNQEGNLLGTPKDKDKLQKELAVRPTSLLSHYLGIEKSGILDKAIISPLEKKYSALVKDVTATTNKWREASSTRWIGSKKEKRDLKLGVLLSQIERNGIDGKFVLSDIVNNKDLMKHYSASEQKKLLELYDELPTKEVDGVTVLDVDAITNSLTAKEKAIINSFRDIMDNELQVKQRFANEQSGETFNEINGYFPRITKGRESSKKSGDDALSTLNDWTNTLYSTGVKTESDRGKSRQGNKIGAYEFNIDKVMKKTIQQVNRDFHLTQTIKEVREVFNVAKSSHTEKGYDMLYNGLQQRISDGTVLQLHTAPRSIAKTVLNNTLQLKYALTLPRLLRYPVELVAETSRIIGGNVTNPKEVVRTIVDKTKSRLNKVKSVRNETSSSFIEGVSDLETVATKIQELTNSPIIHKYSRHDMEFGKEVGSQNNLAKKSVQWALGLVDRQTANFVYMPSFVKEFKNITGKKFNEKEFSNNPDYAAKYKNAIIDASAIADRNTAQWKNIAVKGQGRAEIRVPFSSVKVVDNPLTTPLLTFMGSFGALESAMFAKGLQTAGRSYNSPAERAQGFRESVAIFGAGATYALGISAEFLTYGYLYKKFAYDSSLDDFTNLEGQPVSKLPGYNSSDDPKVVKEGMFKDYMIEMKRLTSPSATGDALVNNALFLATTKYSQLGRTMLTVISGLVSDNDRKDYKTSPVVKDMLKGEEVVPENESTMDMVTRKFNNILESSVSTVEKSTYTQASTNPEYLAGQLIPSMMMLEDIVLKSFDDVRVYNAVANGVFEGTEYEEIKEEIALYQLYASGMKVLGLFTGVPIGARHFLDYNKKQAEMFGVNEEAFQRINDEMHTIDFEEYRPIHHSITKEEKAKLTEDELYQLSDGRYKMYKEMYETHTPNSQ